MFRINCTDENGRKFGIMIDQKNIEKFGETEVNQNLIDKMNANRAKFGGTRNAAITEWSVAN